MTLSGLGEKEAWGSEDEQDILGEYLDELLDYAAEVVPLLPAQFKGCLMAIARRKELLNDRALGALADAEHVCLDCHATGVSEAALQHALAASPQLRHVDLRGCPVGPSTLRLLGSSCPRLEVLRIGGHEATDGNPACSSAVRKLLPRVEKAEHAEIESWECLADNEQGRAECPLLLVNPSSDDVAQQSLSPEYNPAESIDTRLFAGFGDPSRWERQEGGSEAPVAHIAERFRLAYLEQAQQRRERAERADRRWAQQRRREIRQSPAEVAIRRWLNES
ncbi:hypothetical protein N2152v2_008838 [Parachlorella kessleri]